MNLKAQIEELSEMALAVVRKELTSEDAFGRKTMAVEFLKIYQQWLYNQQQADAEKWPGVIGDNSGEKT